MERREQQKEREEVALKSRKKTKKSKEHLKRWAVPESQLEEVMRGSNFEVDDLDMVDIVE